MRRTEIIIGKLARLAKQELAIATIGFVLALLWGIVMPGLSADPIQNGALPYTADILCFNLDASFQVDARGEKLYCVKYETPKLRLNSAHHDRPGRSIFTRWDLATGKCERVQITVGHYYWFGSISPNGSRIFATCFAQEKLERLEKIFEAKKSIDDLSPEDLGMLGVVICTEQLRPIHTLRWPFHVLSHGRTEGVFFLEDDRLGFLINRQRDAKSKPSYTLSVCRIEQQLREELRVPVTGLEDYSILSVHANGERKLALLARELAPPDARAVACYLVIYDVRNKVIATKYELGKVKYEESDSVGRSLPVSILAINGAKTLALVQQGNQYLLCDLATPPRILERPLNFRDEPMSAHDMSQDGKFVVFGSTRIVIYNVAEKKYKVLDTMLEDICTAWDNPPFGSPLRQVVGHPMIQLFMPLMKRMMIWRHVRFLGRGNRLLGITSYGKVVVWDVEREKIINSFRIMKPGFFDTKIAQILGLD